MSKKVNIIVTQPPYGKEDAYSAIPLAETQAAAGNSPSITFVSGGVHSVVKGQKTGYGDAAVWQKDVPSVEATIIKAKDSVRFYALDADLKKRGVADTEIIEGISKLNIDELTIDVRGEACPYPLIRTKQQNLQYLCAERVVSFF